MSGGLFERLAGAPEPVRVVPVAHSVFHAAPAVGGGTAPAPLPAVRGEPDGAGTFATWGARLPVLLPGAWGGHDEAPLVAVLRRTGFIPRAVPVPAPEPPPPAAAAPKSAPAPRVRR